MPTPIRKPLLTANNRRLCLEWAQMWLNLTMAHWQHAIFGDESRFQLYLVDGRLKIHRLPGERFQQRCQAYRVEAGGCSVHAWGAFHGGAKSHLVLTDNNLTGELYKGILPDTLVPLTRLQPHRTYLGCIGPCNHQYGQLAPEPCWASPSPAV